MEVLPADIIAWGAIPSLDIKKLRLQLIGRRLANLNISIKNPWRALRLDRIKLIFPLPSFFIHSCPPCSAITQ